MGLPAKLKMHHLFLNGLSQAGVSAEVQLPKIALKLEEWRGGGMIGAVPWSSGVDKIELEYTLGGFSDAGMRTFGSAVHDGEMARFAGAYQDGSTGGVKAVEMVCRGMVAELDFGKAKDGDDTEHKRKMVCSYYKLSVDGQDWIEIDMLAATFIVFGQDRYAQIRAAAGY
jgi:hypothetical protein